MLPNIEMRRLPGIGRGYNAHKTEELGKEGTLGFGIWVAGSNTGGPAWRCISAW